MGWLIDSLQFMIVVDEKMMFGSDDWTAVVDVVVRFGSHLLVIVKF